MEDCTYPATGWESRGQQKRTEKQEASVGAAACQPVLISTASPSARTVWALRARACGEGGEIDLTAARRKSNGPFVTVIVTAIVTVQAANPPAAVAATHRPSPGRRRARSRRRARCTPRAPGGGTSARHTTSSWRCAPHCATCVAVCTVGITATPPCEKGAVLTQMARVLVDSANLVGRGCSTRRPTATTATYLSTCRGTWKRTVKQMASVGHSLDFVFSSARTGPTWVCDASHVQKSKRNRIDRRSWAVARRLYRLEGKSKWCVLGQQV